MTDDASEEERVDRILKLAQLFPAPENVRALARQESKAFYWEDAAALSLQQRLGVTFESKRSS